MRCKQFAELFIIKVQKDMQTEPSLVNGLRLCYKQGFTEQIGDDKAKTNTILKAQWIDLFV
jgi:hypothetical protein